MKLSKFLNNKFFLIVFICFAFFLKSVLATEAIDIWNLEDNKSKNETNKNQVEQIENNSSQSIYQNQVNKKKVSLINEEKNISSDKLNIIGIYDPSDNDLSMDMWIKSDGSKILKIIKRIENLKLSYDAINILNIALLTNSNLPIKNITYDEFLKIKSDWLIKQKNLSLIETYLRKNEKLENGSDLINYYIDYYLSYSDINKACELFDSIKISNLNNYISKFNIYCLINLNRKEEAQLRLDLLKEFGFSEKFFENKFNYLMGYDDNPGIKISENSLLDFHLSHVTNPNFKFEPDISTSKLIWKYLSSANLLEKASLINLDDEEKILTIEKATHDKNYSEKELFKIYEKFMFNINQLLTVKDTYKSLSKIEGRALLYQGILLSKVPSEKIQLIQLLKKSYIKDNISNAFDINLKVFLNEIDLEDVPSNYKDFYEYYLKDNTISKKRIKFNNKIIHQSKLLNHFIQDFSKKKTEKDLRTLLKNRNKYFFSIKDIILLESLKSDGVQIPKKYKNIYEKKDSNIPEDIQILINNEEIGLVLLRLAEIIGEDEINDMDSETIYFIISALNQLNIDELRNNILLKVLPLKI